MLLRGGAGTTLTAFRVSQTTARINSRQYPYLPFAISFAFTRSTTSASRLSVRPPASSQSHSRYLWLVSSALALSASALLLQKQPALLEAPSESQSSQDGFRSDPSTSQAFPVILPPAQSPLPSRCKELRLIGLGVRTVSFLRIQVYVAGLYIDSSALPRLAEVRGWNGYERSWMSESKQGHNSEELIEGLLDEGVSFAIRIVPVRSTDYGHLRDGFLRAIQGRAKLARKTGQMSESMDEALSQSLQALKDAFPRASLPKGKALDLLFLPSSSTKGAYDLIMEEGGNVLGKVVSPQGSVEHRFGVARQLLLAYLANKDEISKPFKQSVAEGFEQAIRLSEGDVFWCQSNRERHS